MDLGAFSSIHSDIRIEDMTFLAGGSTVDYIFLKAVMIAWFKTYLEIGTWMGESIVAVSRLQKNATAYHCLMIQK